MMDWASIQLVTFQCKHVQCYTLLLCLSLIELSKLQALNLYIIQVQFWCIPYLLKLLSTKLIQEQNVDEIVVKKSEPQLAFFTFPCHQWTILNILNSNVHDASLVGLYNSYGLWFFHVQLVLHFYGDMIHKALLHKFINEKTFNNYM